MKPWPAFSLLSAAWLLSPVLLAGLPAATQAQPLGVQACDTRCQSAETDCDLACDQVAECVEQCRKVSDACVQKCHDAPPPESKPEAPTKPSEPTKKAPAKNPPKAPTKTKPA